MKVRYTLILLLLIFLQQTLFADPVRERVYLQTDKQTYLSGELIWMKFFLTDEKGIPVSFSKVGYVELLDGSTAQVQAKLDITEGVAEGWLEIPVTLPTGNYHLIAYTRNMRNESEKVFFHKIIGIVNTFKTDMEIETDSISRSRIPEVVPEGNITVVSDKKTYPVRVNAAISIEGLPENIHSLSLSVAGMDFIQYDQGIMSWSDNLPPADVAVRSEFLPDYEGHIISGKIVDVSTGAPLKGGRVFPLLGFVGDQIRLFGGLTNRASDVQFVTKRIKGVHELATTTFSSSDSKYRIDIQSPFAQHTEKKLPEFVLNQSWEEQLLRRSIGLQVQYAYVIDSMNKVDTTYAHFQWEPDRSYILDEYTRFTTMEEVIIEFIPSLSFRRLNNKRFLSVLLNDNNTFSLGNSLVMIDGIPIMDHETVFRYDPLLVYKIDVYKDKYVFGNIHFEGLVFITTYKQDYPSLKTDETTHIFDYEGTQAHRYFYLPSYADDSVRNSRIPDYRHTLLWMPEVSTNGKSALSIPFSTSDLTGDFQITVEGLTEDGKVIRGSSFFKVENSK